MKISTYHNSLTKNVLDFILSLLGIIISLPLILIIGVVIKLTSPGPVFFKQKRLGKNDKEFTIIKFRTMTINAEKLQKRLKPINEADGPVFKIKNDPRFTKFGKTLSQTGLDELPQLLNILKGEMSFVGPRPLPIREARSLTIAQKIRQSIKPGLTSLWVVRGAHTLTFDQWMKLDQYYIKHASFCLDLHIIIRTGLILF